MDTVTADSKHASSNSLENWSEFIKALSKINFSTDVTVNTTTPARKPRTGIFQMVMRQYSAYCRNHFRSPKKKLRQVSRKRQDKKRTLIKLSNRYKKELRQLLKLRQRRRRRRNSGEAVPLQVDLPHGGQ